MKKIITNLINEGKLIADKPVKTDSGIQIFKSGADGSIYAFNPNTRRAYRYSADLMTRDNLTLAQYNAQVSALKARLEADKARAEREKIAQWRKDHNEGEHGEKPTGVKDGAVNAPATKTAVRLDAEREDSRFDGRQAEKESIFCATEAESYENKGSFFKDKQPVVGLGYHKAILTGWEEVCAKSYTNDDGDLVEKKAYLLFTFSIKGVKLETRLYDKQYNSFTIQANKAHHGLFNYTEASEAIDSLVGEQFNIWVKWNDVLGELQADYYDVEAYKKYKAERQKFDPRSVQRGYSRIVEERATR